jgi:hypothetical protein
LYIYQWIRQEDNVQYPPDSSDLTPIDIYLWGGSLKDVISYIKPLIPEICQEETEMLFATIPVHTLATVACTVVCQTPYVYKLMVGTLNTGTSATCVAAIPFFV